MLCEHVHCTPHLQLQVKVRHATLCADYCPVSSLSFSDRILTFLLSDDPLILGIHLS